MTEALEKLQQEIEAEAEHKGLELIELTQRGPMTNPVLDIRFDSLSHPGEITLDEIGEAQAWVSRLLDQKDLFAGSYTLEVSSPGLDMLLTKPKHYERALGKTIKLTTTGELYDDKEHPRKHYKGRLISANPLVIEDSNLKFEIAKDHIVEARIVPTFE